MSFLDSYFKTKSPSKLSSKSLSGRTPKKSKTPSKSPSKTLNGTVSKRPRAYKTMKQKPSYKVATRAKTKNIVANFMKKTKHQRQSQFLQNICSDSGMCIAFGIESNKIKDFFNQFAAFDYVVPPITSIGVPSVNGFVKEINYRHRGYTANAILKSSVSNEADNLFYEYTVGLQVNQWAKYFPCFVETYGLYKYLDPIDYRTIKDTKNIEDVSILKNSLDLVSVPSSSNQFLDYADICTDSMYYAVLIQHIKGATSLYDVYDDPSAWTNHANMGILAQVYLVLAKLTNDFVHYDLHTGNVMLYAPAPGKYVQFHYHYGDTNILTFKSYYVTKMIDYGRSYIKGSKYIHQRICNTKECDPDCGYNFGFAWMTKTLNADDYFITSLLRNPSHDLKLFYEIYPDKVTYGQGIDDPDKKELGTRPNPNSEAGKINNVGDAGNYFEGLLREPDFQAYYANTTEFPPDKKFGDLHIYMNMGKAMRFDKTA